MCSIIMLQGILSCIIKTCCAFRYCSCCFIICIHNTRFANVFSCVFIHSASCLLLCRLKLLLFLARCVCTHAHPLCVCESELMCLCDMFVLHTYICVKKFGVYWALLGVATLALNAAVSSLSLSPYLSDKYMFIRSCVCEFV